MSIEYPLASHFDVNTRALFELCPIATAKNWCKALWMATGLQSNMTWEILIAMSDYQRVNISFCRVFFAWPCGFFGVGEEGLRTSRPFVWTLKKGVLPHNVCTFPIFWGGHLEGLGSDKTGWICFAQVATGFVSMFFSILLRIKPWCCSALALATPPNIPPLRSIWSLECCRFGRDLEIKTGTRLIIRPFFRLLWFSKLVGGLEHFFTFPYIGNVIIPTDELIFFRGVVYHQPVVFVPLDTLDKNRTIPAVMAFQTLCHYPPFFKGCSICKFFF